MRLAKWMYAPLRGRRCAGGMPWYLAVAAFGGSLLLFGHLGREFVPLDEKDIAFRPCAFRVRRSQSPDAVQVEKTLEPFEVAFCFQNRDRQKWPQTTCPNASDTFVMLKPTSSG
jgi:Cu/Ag efflux pump CusA